MIIAFTGTREGMTPQQQKEIKRFLQDGIRAAEVSVYHGCCRGADRDFHDLVLPHLAWRIFACPGDEDQSLWARERWYDFARIHPPQGEPPASYHHRNRMMVDLADLLIATPKGATEEQRSGTWSTIRYAQRTLGKQIAIVFPDGTFHRYSSPGSRRQTVPSPSE